MPLGPGKYDELCSQVRESTGARAAIVIVIEGCDGSGFSCQAEAEWTLRLPEILDEIAREIRAIRKRGEI